MLAEKWIIVEDNNGAFVTIVNKGSHVFLGVGASIKYFDDEAAAIEYKNKLCSQEMHVA